MYGTGAENASFSVDGSGPLASLTDPIKPLIFRTDGSFASAGSVRYAKQSRKSWAVTALPSCHFKPLRSFSVIDRLSGASCQDSARSGLALPVPSFHNNREKTWSYISKLTAEKFHGLKLLKSPASAYVNVPPLVAPG